MKIDFTASAAPRAGAIVAMVADNKTLSPTAQRLDRDSGGAVRRAVKMVLDFGCAALAIVDEAHLIPGKATFEEIRLLTNFQLDDRNLIAIVLVGQPELRERLRHRAYRALTQRIGVAFDLVPLEAEDTRAYFAHRLSVAGATRPLFSDAAIARLHAAAQGVPRVLNQLATQALLEGMARGATQVDDGIAETVASERDFGVPVGAGG